MGDSMPGLWHWCAFGPDAMTRDLKTDGHAKGGDFLPPIKLPRRMWAGGALEFHAPLRIGDVMTRTSTIREVVEKETGAGPMVLVTVDHIISGPQGVAITERQDIAYLEIPKTYSPPKKRPTPSTSDFQIEMDMTSPLLFRYSAVTFNAHRIHYDAEYARNEESYPGLVVHGPLQATLLMQAAVQHRGAMPQYFDFRGVHPAFAGEDFSILGVNDDVSTMRLFTASSGHQCMQANAIWETTV
ncbi:MAG: acyl dehydratase [Rhodobacteraceae bacterium]|nr:acyl dehydratase [Paracoccaceae bacterium]